MKKGYPEVTRKFAPLTRRAHFAADVPENVYAWSMPVSLDEWHAHRYVDANMGGSSELGELLHAWSAMDQGALGNKR